MDKYSVNVTAADALERAFNDGRKPYKTAQTVLQPILFVAIVIGNVSVLVALLLKSKLHSKFSRLDFLIRNLAISDLSVGFIVVLSAIMGTHLGNFYGGNALCKIQQYLELVVTLSSTYMIVALSLDRLDAIARPMHFAGRDLRVKLMTGGAWLLSAALAAPMLYYAHVVVNEKKQTSTDQTYSCRIVFIGPRGWQIYISLVAATVLIIPGIILTICCSIIIHIILNPQNGQSQNGQSQEADFKEGKAISRTETHHRSTTRGSFPRMQAMQKFQMTFLIVIAFVVCWSPYFIFNLLHVFGHMERTEGDVTYLIEALAPLNSCVNPIIYGLFTGRIFQKVFTDYRQKCKQQRLQQQNKKSKTNDKV